MDNVPKETPAVSVMKHKPLEIEVVVRDGKDDRLLLHPIQRRNRLTEKKATKRKVLTSEVRFCVEITMVITRRLSFGIFPCV